MARFVDVTGIPSYPSQEMLGLANDTEQELSPDLHQVLPLIEQVPRPELRQVLIITVIELELSPELRHVYS